MISRIQKSFRSIHFSFGSTSSIITSLALIIGLDFVANAKTVILGSLLIIAIADNISDSFGIHMYQESEGLSHKKVWSLTLSNFFSRFLTSLGFIAIVFLMPLPIAIIFSLFYGLIILSIVSFTISRDRKTNPLKSIIEHLSIAIFVIMISKVFGGIIQNIFQ